MSRYDFLTFHCQMVNGLIPQPPPRDLPRMRRRAHAIGEILQAECGMNKSRYQQFKERVRELAVMYLSKPYASYKMQPSREWELLSSK
ncbi:hypothetical protein L218DRAFT_955058 [Marasmius fiardii PR-910]|nr:hypothetical protein L218DRAFT_955058 [Marasmius fiardii PR-910]